jgi:hypothetical protein
MSHDRDPQSDRPHRRRDSRWRPLGLLAGALAWLAVVPASAGEPAPYLAHNWYLSGGSYLTDFSTEAAVGAAGNLGTLVVAEEDLGIDAAQSMFRFEGLYRFNERHSLETGYWGVNRDGDKTLDKQIEFNGITYDLGATVTSGADVSYVRLGWRYSAVRSGRGEAGFAAGLSTFSLSFLLSGEGTISDGMGGTETGMFLTEEEFVAPAPTIGMFVTFAMHPRLVLRAKADFLDVQVDDYEANLTETLIGLDWYFVKNVAVGVGTLTTRIEFEDNGEDPLQAEYRQSGLLAYMSASF